VTPGRNFPQKFAIKSDLAVIAPLTVITLNGHSEERFLKTLARKDLLPLNPVSLALTQFLV
jgi:hypothetical protein